ncbi:MAG: tellurium resistance protein TerC [Armatimonadota bacterium]|nr:tellurium resistance protein TerC [Armatimonadota bacterium]MDR7426673.1 tellurium resistance protein TerC [Armatimonadota bacterium]MDR7464380.1 tellurium resistance protein TerC [Armatimonadota bacterium]MDR7469224.1 tellurium resistance protein TerC [Armatimonadota bacterium]MDR7475065.1 tellurium resistance protein TerC [Armatimonadota bacterium]
MQHDPLAVLLIVLQLIYLEGILSIDNAAVLGAMVAHLPRHTPIPWPRILRFLQRPVHRLLGGQRPAALKVGLLGAYLGRGLMLFVATWVIRNRWLLLLGGLYLIRLGVDHLGETPAEARAAEARARGESVRRSGRPFWSVVLGVELADLAFSLDNVVAAVALSRQFWVVMTGVALGIITMRFAAGIFVYLIERFPVLEAAAYLLVLSIGGGLVVEDFFHVRPTDVQRFLISFSILLLTLTYGRSPTLQRLGQRLRWLRRALGYIDLLFVYALRPLAWLLAGAVALGRAVRRASARVSFPAPDAAQAPGHGETASRADD